MKRKLRELKEFYDGAGGRVGRWSCAVDGYTFNVIVKKDGWLRKKMCLEVWGPYVDRAATPEPEPEANLPPKPFSVYRVIYRDGSSQEIRAEYFQEYEGIVRFIYHDEIVAQMRWDDVWVISLRRQYRDD